MLSDRDHTCPIDDLAVFEIGFYDPQGAYHLLTRKGTWKDRDSFLKLRESNAIPLSYTLVFLYHG